MDWTCINVSCIQHMIAVKRPRDGRCPECSHELDPVDGLMNYSAVTTSVSAAQATIEFGGQKWLAGKRERCASNDCSSNKKPVFYALGNRPLCAECLGRIVSALRTLE